MILLPAYCRDYKSSKEVMEDWREDKDFIFINDNPAGRDLPINRSQIEEMGYSGYINVRYYRLRKVVVMKLERGVKV